MVWPRRRLAVSLFVKVKGGIDDGAGSVAFLRGRLAVSLFVKVKGGIDDGVGFVAWIRRRLTGSLVDFDGPALPAVNLAFDS